MAPALRMTRSIKEKLPVFFFPYRSFNIARGGHRRFDTAVLYIFLEIWQITRLGHHVT
jgi:hypothetical protein